MRGRRNKMQKQTEKEKKTENQKKTNGETSRKVEMPKLKNRKAKQKAEKQEKW